MPFFSDVERLRDLPRSIVSADDLVKALGNYSYGELDMGGCGYRDRPSDLEADDLSEELAIERKQEDPNWKFVPKLEELQEEVERLAEYCYRRFLGPDHQTLISMARQ